MKKVLKQIKTFFKIHFHKKTVSQMEEKWEKEKILLETDYKIDNEKRQLRLKYKGEALKATTSKILIAFLFLNCTAIEIFTGIITIKSFSLAEQQGISPDLTPLITLIGAVVGEVIGFAVYAIKATKENQQGGIVYDLAMMDRESGVMNNDQPQILNNDNDADVEVTFSDYGV